MDKVTSLREKFLGSARGLCTENPDDYMARGISAGDCLRAVEMLDEMAKCLKVFAAHVGKSGETVKLSIGKDTWTGTLTTTDFERAREVLQRYKGEGM